MLVSTFEVVVVSRNGNGFHKSEVITHGKVIRKDIPIAEIETKMYHVDAKDHGHACEKGKKYGRVVSARKVKIDDMVDAQALYIEHLKLDQKPYGADSIFQNAVAMDDMIWLKKAKRSERIEENKRDRTIDK